MTGAPLVSVVIPTWQRAHLIVDALDSVAAQTWRDLEIVVADDGSDDGTDLVVSKWAAAHPHIQLRYSWAENAGGNAARNRGIANAYGELIAFLDSDDTWSPEKITLQMECLLSDHGIGAVYSGFVETDAASGRVLHRPRIAPASPDMLGRLLVRDETAPTSAWVVRRDVLTEVGGFDEALSARQDWDLWIRLAVTTKIAAVTETLMQLRHHSGPRTASDPERELRAYAAIRTKYRVLLSKQPIWRRLAATAAFHRRAGRVYRHYAGRPGVALGHHLAAVACWPLESDSWYALIGWFIPDPVRRQLRRLWNRALGQTGLAIRSH